MQNAETILTVIRERGKRGLPLERVYRLLYNPQLYLMAYAKIYRNKGAMTPGVNTETADGMAMTKINEIISLMRYERFRWHPTRRTYIEKKHSTKKRPLSMPTWTDKLVQEVIRTILEAYYEPTFSEHSHGFRPDRGCHTALSEIDNVWTGTRWFLEGDIKGCFDHIDHSILLTILAEKIHDGRFLHLIEGALNAGYLEEWRWNPTLSGSPQGGIVSPVLANIYLSKLDAYVENTLLPQYNRKDKRGYNWTYRNHYSLYQYQGKRGHWEKARDHLKEGRKLPTLDTHDPDYRRLYYIRYADDFLLGFAGPKEEAEEIKRQIGQFLHEELKLELSKEKTVITHARTKAARFLGYEIGINHGDTRITRSAVHTKAGSRAVNGTIALLVPLDVLKEKCARYMQGGKPIHRKELTHESVFTIINHYQMEYRGLVEYYQLAQNRSSRLGHLHWVTQTSLLKTLAHKLKISVRQVRRRYGTKIQTEDGVVRYVIREVILRDGKRPLIATFGGISLKRKYTTDKISDPTLIWTKRSELLQRLLADTCELCGSQENIQVHHIKHMKTLQRKGRKPRPLWMEVMASRRRKTLVLCQRCHVDVHQGHPQTAVSKKNTGEPDDRKQSSPVRRGTDGKVVTQGDDHE